MTKQKKQIVTNTCRVLLVVQSNYLLEVNNEHVILGNSALLKCTIPSFVAELLNVASWTIYSDAQERVLDANYYGNQQQN